MISTAGRAWWGFLTVLLILAVWICSTGQVFLYGLPVETLEGLARGQGLLGPGHGEMTLDGLSTLGALPGDPVTWGSAAVGLLNLAAALVLYMAGIRAWRNPISPTLALGAVFFAAGSLWVESPTPATSLLHLLLALVIAALISGVVPLLAGLVLVVALLSPEQAISCYLALAYLGYRRQAAYGLFVPTLAVFGVGCLLLSLATDYRLQPSLSGWTVLSVLPLALLAYPGQIRAARGGIYAALLLGAALTGTPELASALALGDAVFVALERSRDGLAPDPESPAANQGIRATAAIGLVATLVLAVVTLPGEQHLNRRILVPAQKAKVPLPELFTLFSLETHARRFADDAWRSKVPFPELGASDFELALELSRQNLERGLCPITTDGRSESRKVALLYALVSGQSLRGWDSPEHLASPLLLCKLRGENFLHSGPAVILRDGATARLAPPAKASSDPAPLDFRSVLVLPYRVQTVSSQTGGSYRWTSGGETYVLCFPDRPAELVLTSRPGEYRAVSQAAGGAVRDFEVAKVVWELSELPQDQDLPSRSLLPMTLRLTNRGEGPLSSELVDGWRLETDPETSFGQFLQPSSKPFILFPGESTQLDFTLATPPKEGKYRVRASALTVEGESLQIPLEGPAEVRTWRRLPAVGTWVEEP